MPKKLAWTDAQDLQLKRLRAEGASWEAISATLGFSRWALIERARRIGARRPPPEFVPPPDDPLRDPLPPGDPRSWGVLTAGTSLEGCPYPLPVFPR